MIVDFINTSEAAINLYIVNYDIYIRCKMLSIIAIHFQHPMHFQHPQSVNFNITNQLSDNMPLEEQSTKAIKLVQLDSQILITVKQR